jgi:hypothetical protein
VVLVPRAFVDGHFEPSLVSSPINFLRSATSDHEEVNLPDVRWTGSNADDIRRYGAELAALVPDVNPIAALCLKYCGVYAGSSNAVQRSVVI